MERLKSGVFGIEDFEIGGTVEQVIVGGRDKFHLLQDGFRDIKQIGVIGWGSQGPAHAQNLRDSLAGTDIKVVVGLRPGSTSIAKAEKAGFSQQDGTLGEMYDVISKSDLAIILISDAAQVENFDKIIGAVKPGAILGFSHGFILGHLDSIGRRDDLLFNDFSVVAVCPKGMGPSVRRLYEQGKEVNGAGINCSIAIEKDLDGRATDAAIAWAIAIGAPYIFQTTLENEYRSDIFGERSVLLGGVHGMVEALFRSYVMDAKMGVDEAFLMAVENVTGPLSSLISKKGIIGVYNQFNESERRVFDRAYSSAYLPYYTLLQEIYDEVASGNEIRSVVMAGKRLEKFGWTTIDGTILWQVGAKVRAKRNPDLDIESLGNIISPVTAGIYCGMMMAQIDILLENGHCLSEVCNETVIEAVDSLNPYMHARGVADMVDNCSITARLGTRKWGPRFDHVTMQTVMVQMETSPADQDLMEGFRTHRIHEALASCATMRPSVDISVN